MKLPIQGATCLGAGEVTLAEPPRWGYGSGALTTTERDNYGRPLRMRRVPAGLVAAEMCPCEIPEAHTHTYEVVCPVCGYSELTDVAGHLAVPSHSIDAMTARLEHGAAPGPCCGTATIVASKLYPHYYVGANPARTSKPTRQTSQR